MTADNKVVGTRPIEFFETENGTYESEELHFDKEIKMPSAYPELTTDENDIVVDCFGGSGSTLMACEQLNRICYSMELDPEYVDVIIDRWEKYTGKKAKLVRR